MNEDIMQIWRWCAQSTKTDEHFAAEMGKMDDRINELIAYVNRLNASLIQVDEQIDRLGTHVDDRIATQQEIVQNVLELFSMADTRFTLLENEVKLPQQSQAPIQAQGDIHHVLTQQAHEIRQLKENQRKIEEAFNNLVSMLKPS